jgi:hypothetical protein
MYHPDEIESEEGRRSELAIAGLLPYQTVAAEKDILFKRSRYKEFIIKISPGGKMALFQLNNRWICACIGKMGR